MDKVIDIANEFNLTIKALARAYAAKKKGTFEEEKSLRTNKRLAIVIAADPMYLIETAGPMFLKYADVIQAKDFSKVMKLEFQEEKELYKATEDGSKHSYEAMDGKIRFIKKIFKEGTDEERKEIVDHLESLLSSYCTYALIIKDIEAKKLKKK